MAAVKDVPGHGVNTGFCLFHTINITLLINVNVPKMYFCYSILVEDEGFFEEHLT